MENTTKLKYLKGIVLISIVFYILFVVLNTIETIWESAVFVGIDRTSTLKVMAIEGKIHFWANNADYIVQLVFYLLLNHVVRKYTPGKGVHFLLVVLAILPLINYIMIFILWRKLNRDLFTYLGVNSMKSDVKITTIWFIHLTYLFIVLSIPAIIYFFRSPELVSSISYYERFAYLIKSIYLLVISILYLLYYLELKRVLDQVEPGMSDTSSEMLLDN